MTKRNFWALFLAVWIAAFVWSGKLVYDAKKRADAARIEAEMLKKRTPIIAPGQWALTFSDGTAYYVAIPESLPLECPDYKICI